MYIEAFLGIMFIFLMTSIGSALVLFLRKDINPRFSQMVLGFSAGVMISASIWSLLLPALDRAGDSSLPSFIVIPLGFLVGALLLFFFDILAEKKSNKYDYSSFKVFIAVTIHNIPEGLAVGLAFGGIASLTQSALLPALALAFGIGIQNLPEGIAVSLPLTYDLKSSKKAFGYGVISGVVEPIFGFIGFYLAIVLNSFMPFLLSLAAGSMIYVSVNELIPSAISNNQNNSKNYGIWSFIAGFILMMILDIALS